MAVYVLSYSSAPHIHTTHTSQHPPLSILPSPSYSCLLICQKKWLSFKRPSQHGKITRLSSRSAPLHTHSYTTNPAYMFFSSSFLPSSSTTSAPFTLLPPSMFYPDCPHRGDFTGSEIPRCQHMSLAINLCHRAISLAPSA